MDDLIDDDDWTFRGDVQSGDPQKDSRLYNRRNSGSGGSKTSGLGRGPYKQSRARSQRAVVNSSIRYLSGNGSAKAMAHARYLERDSSTQEQDGPEPFTKADDDAEFTRDPDDVDLSDFQRRCRDDRHQFRVIISPEGAHRLDMKEYVRDVMDQAEEDLETELEWAGVVHDNTDQPHAHVLIRGVDERGDDLVIDSDYLNHGLRYTAEDVATYELGPRSNEQVRRSFQKQVTANRMTSLDREIANDAESRGDDRPIDLRELSAPSGAEGVDATKFYVQRLRYLEQNSDASLAHSPSDDGYTWRVSDHFEEQLEDWSQEQDILKRMQSADLDRRRLTRQADLPAAGRVVDAGVADEFEDQNYALVDGIDGRVHHVETDVQTSPRPGQFVTFSDGEMRQQPDLGEQVSAQGPTWLDKQIYNDRSFDTPTATSDEPKSVARSVNRAIKERRAVLAKRDVLSHRQAQPGREFLRNLRENERRAYLSAVARRHNKTPRELDSSESFVGRLSDEVDLEGGKIRLCENDSEVIGVPANRYQEDYTGEEVEISKYTNAEGRERYYVDDAPSKDDELVR